VHRSGERRQRPEDARLVLGVQHAHDEVQRTPVGSSDHAPYRYDVTGKLPKGEKTTFKEMANGVPGLELRLPLLFTYGVGALRITLNEFVHLTATSHAQIYGLAPHKGTIAPGSDADIAIWDPEHRVTVDAALLHDNTGYTPYAGRELKGWPVTVLSRGEALVQASQPGTITAARGRGRFIARARTDALLPAQRQIPEIAQLATWNTPLSI
jgi:dihydropyrimidinase